MGGRYNEQKNDKTNDPEDDAGITVQIHTALACKQVGREEEGDTKCCMYHHHDGSKDKAYSEGY